MRGGERFIQKGNRNNLADDQNGHGLTNTQRGARQWQQANAMGLETAKPKNQVKGEINTRRDLQVLAV